MTMSNEHKWMALSIMCIIVQMVCRDNMLSVCLRSIRRLWGAWTWTIDLYVGQECLWPYIRQWQPFSSGMPHVRSLLRMTRHSIHPRSGRYAIQMAVLWTSFQKVMTVSNFTNIGNKFQRIIRNWFCTLHPVRASASISFGCFCNVMSRHAGIKLENLGHAHGCHELCTYYACRCYTNIYACEHLNSQCSSVADYLSWSCPKIITDICNWFSFQQQQAFLPTATSQTAGTVLFCAKWSLT